MTVQEFEVATPAAMASLREELELLGDRTYKIIRNLRAKGFKFAPVTSDGVNGCIMQQFMGRHFGVPIPNTFTFISRADPSNKAELNEVVHINDSYITGDW